MREYIGTLKYDEHYGWFPDIDENQEIVRCKDCKHYRFEDRSHIFNDNRHNDSFCLRFIDGGRMEVEPDGFCAWGERRSG